MTKAPSDKLHIEPRKRSRIKQLVINLLALLLVLLLVRWYMQRDLVSGPVPELSGVSLDQQTVDTRSWRGGPYLVHIWASWCRICRLEEDSINRISANNRVVTIAMQSGDDEDVRDYLAERGFSWLVLNDDNGSLSRRFGIRGVPASFIVDRNGVIRFSEVGYTSGWGMRLRLWLAGFW